MAKSMKFQATLKSGAQIEFAASELSVSGSTLRWTSLDGAFPRLMKMDLDELVALVRLS